METFHAHIKRETIHFLVEIIRLAAMGKTLYIAWHLDPRRISVTCINCLHEHKKFTYCLDQS